MSVGVMKDYKLKQRNLRASHTLGFWGGPTNETTTDRGFWGGPKNPGPVRVGPVFGTGPVPVDSPVELYYRPRHNLGLRQAQ
jgi:hypothetical protein